MFPLNLNRTCKKPTLSTVYFQIHLQQSSHTRYSARNPTEEVPSATMEGDTQFPDVPPGAAAAAALAPHKEVTI